MASADYTYNLMIQVSDTGIHEVGGALKHLGIDVTEFKKITRVVGDELVTTWEVAANGLSHYIAKQAESIALAKGSAAGVEKVGLSQNYAKQDKENAKIVAGEKKVEQIRLNMIRTLDNADLKFANNKVARSIRDQIVAKKAEEKATVDAEKVEAIKLGMIRTLDNANLKFENNRAMRALKARIAQTKIDEAAAKEEAARLAKIEKERLALITQVHAAAHKAIEATKRDEMNAHAQEMKDMEARNREHAKLFADIEKEAGAFAKAAAAEQNANNKAISGSQKHQEGINHLISSVHKLRYAWLTVMTVMGGFTAMHAVERVGHNMVHGFEKSIEFIDEIRRAQTSIANFGITDQGGKSMQQLELFGSSPQKNQVARAKAFGETMVQMARAESIRTGQPLAQILGIAKTLIPHIENKMGLKGNGFLDHAKEVTASVKKLIDITAVFKAVDPLGRRMSFHEFATAEILRGTNEVGAGKKKTGGGVAANFRSLLMREGIKVDQRDMHSLTNLVNKGKISEFTDEFEKVLQKSGISISLLADLSTNTLKPSLDAVKSAFMGFGAVFSTPAFDYALKFFAKLRAYLANLTSSPVFNELLHQWGTTFANVFKGLGLDVENFLNKFDDPSNVMKLMDDVNGIIQVFGELIVLGKKFVQGFFGGPDGSLSDTLDKVMASLKSSEGPMQKLGASVAVFAAAVTKAMPELIKGLTYIVENRDSIAAAFAGFKIGGLPGLAIGSAVGAQGDKDRGDGTSDEGFVGRVVKRIFTGGIDSYFKPNPAVDKARHDAEQNSIHMPGDTKHSSLTKSPTVAFYGPVTIQADKPTDLMHSLQAMLPGNLSGSGSWG